MIDFLFLILAVYLVVAAFKDNHPDIRND